MHALLALFLVWAGREVYLALTARPGTRVDYARAIMDLVQRNQPADAIPGSPDAWPRLLEAANLLSQATERVWPRRAGPEPDFSSLWYPLADPEYHPTYTKAQIREMAERGVKVAADLGVDAALEEMAKARRAVRPLVTPPSGRLIDVRLPELGQARQLARLCAGRMYLTHRDGADSELVPAFEQCLALGRVVAGQGFLIDYLVGAAVVVMANDRVRTLVSDRPPDAATLAALLVAMDRQLPLPPMTVALEGEFLGTLDTIQWTHTDDGRGDGRLILTELKALRGGAVSRGVFSFINLGGMFYASKAATTLKAEGFFERCRAQVALAPWQRAGAAGIDTFGEALSPRFVLLKVLVPALGRSMESADMCAVGVAGTRVMLAVELFNQRAGRYPESIAELTPGILPTVPLDPWSGKPFVYRRLDPATDPYRRSYTLYSVGADGVDNGGVYAIRWNESALSAAKGNGLDYVFNLPPAHIEDQFKAGEER
jgi:hypothetical protein